MDCYPNLTYLPQMVVFFLFFLLPRFFGKSDPFVRLKGLVGDSYLWGGTETVRDTLSPTWNESFAIDLLAKMPMGGKLVPFVVRLFFFFKIQSCLRMLQYDSFNSFQRTIVRLQVH